MVEGAPLLREYGLKAHRGFESLSLRQIYQDRSMTRPDKFDLEIRNRTREDGLTNLPGANLNSRRLARKGKIQGCIL